MKTKRRSFKCRHCRKSFKASTGRQIFCKRRECFRARRYEYWKTYIKRWNASHPGYWRNYLRKWRREHPDYFTQWRRKHPDYFKNWYRRRKARLAAK